MTSSNSCIVLFFRCICPRRENFMNETIQAVCLNINQTPDWFTCGYVIEAVFIQYIHSRNRSGSFGRYEYTITYDLIDFDVKRWLKVVCAPYPNDKWEEKKKLCEIMKSNTLSNEKGRKEITSLAGYFYDKRKITTR